MSASMTEPSREEFLLAEIIDLIRQGEIIPVLGPELIKVPQGGAENQMTGLYDKLAAGCREKWNADDEGSVPSTISSFDLSRCLVSHPDYGSDPNKAYQELAQIYREVRRNAATPSALVKLARIECLRIFISLTFDDFLESALNQVRFDGNPRTKVLSFWLKKVPTNEELEAAFDSELPIVIKIFGSIDRPLNRFAVSESDYIEAIYRLHAFERSPGRLFDLISERHILLLGNAFAEWIARFFLRLTRSHPLWFTEGRTKQYLVASVFETDPLLKFFLRKCTKMTELVSGHDLDGFVTKLVARLEEKKADNIEGLGIGAASESSKHSVGCVFISYAATKPDGCASVDAAAAARLAKVLDDYGIETWLDRTGGLNPGDEFKVQIKRRIEQCPIFLALISTNTEERLDGFFRREWAWAAERGQDFTGTGRPFIIPIVIDDLEPSQLVHVPHAFMERSIAKAPGGIPDLELIRCIKECVRSARRIDRRR
jgi:SAM-dependent methyltransferase